MQYCIIPFSGDTMSPWQFLDYITEDNQNPIIDWYGTLPPEAKAIFDIDVKAFSVTEDWQETKALRRKFKTLDREHAGMSQIMFETATQRPRKVEKRHFRAFGLFNRIDRSFIFFGGCEKHGTLGTLPPHARTDAMAIMRKFQQGKGTTREHPIII